MGRDHGRHGLDLRGKAHVRSAAVLAAISVGIAAAALLIAFLLPRGPAEVGAPEAAGGKAGAVAGPGTPSSADGCDGLPTAQDGGRLVDDVASGAAPGLEGRQGGGGLAGAAPVIDEGRPEARDPSDAVVADGVVAGGAADSTDGRDEGAGPASGDAAGSADAGTGLLLAPILDEGEVSGRRSALPLVEEARSVLADYRDRGTCVLLRAGYLDLFGRVWSCTVAGGTWVEVQVLSDTSEGGTDVTVVRMDARQWTTELGQEGDVGESE